jgi:hypothetical protein
MPVGDRGCGMVGCGFRLSRVSGLDFVAKKSSLTCLVKPLTAWSHGAVDHLLPSTMEASMAQLAIAMMLMTTAVMAMLIEPPPQQTSWAEAPFVGM